MKGLKPGRIFKIRGGDVRSGEEVQERSGEEVQERSGEEVQDPGRGCKIRGGGPRSGEKMQDPGRRCKIQEGII